MFRAQQGARIVSGWNPALSTAMEALDPVGGLNYPSSIPANAAIFSSSANDTAAGTGARTVFIEYLDSSYNTQYQTATLDGTNAVSITPPLRVQESYVYTAGSGGVTAGTVDIKHTSATLFLARLYVGFNKGRCATICVPANHIGLVTRVFGSITSAAARYGEFFLQSKGVHADAPWVELAVGACGGASNAHFSDTLKHPILYTEKTDIRMSCIADAAALGHGGFEIVLKRVS